MPNNNVMQVAGNIINIANDKGVSITNLKLQKLLYFAQGECFAEINMPMFVENMQAWQLGPVSPEVYREYCLYGASSIPKNEEVEELEVGDRSILENVVDNYGKLSAWDLVDITHEQTPWDFTYNILGARAPIDNNMIRDEFRR